MFKSVRAATREADARVYTVTTVSAVREVEKTTSRSLGVRIRDGVLATVGKNLLLAPSDNLVRNIWNIAILFRIFFNEERLL